MVGHSSAQATAVLLPGLLMRPELHSLPPLPETPLVIRQLPEEKPSVEVKRLLSAVVRLVEANRGLL